MSESGKNVPDEQLKIAAAPPAEIGFETAEMIDCAACKRKNPPNRSHCLYCAAPLANSAARSGAVKMTHRTPDEWEKGWNLIFAPPAESAPPADFHDVRRAFDFDEHFLSEIFKKRARLPLLRLATANDAETARLRLEDLGVPTVIVSDEQLAADTPPRRLRSLDMSDSMLTLTLFNTNEKIQIAAENLVLIVTGALYERRTEALETRKKGKLKTLESSETASDEILIDIYERDNATGYRIPAKGFDFSALGADKGMLAAENLRKLTARLGDFSAQAVIADDYESVRGLLDRVWEPKIHKNVQGLKRSGFGRYDFTNVSVSSNAPQFTKYSRLRRQIL